MRPAGCFGGAITQNIVHRRERFAADNSGGIVLQGALREVIVEGCTFGSAASTVRVEPAVRGAWLAGNGPLATAAAH